MPPTHRTPARTHVTTVKPSLDTEVQAAVAWLRRNATKATLAGMARYAIPSGNAFGVTMSQLKVLAKQLGRNHALAVGLWDTGFYDARMLATLIDEPARVTSAQMERWCRDFDSWAICDTACFALFDKTPHAWPLVAKWAGSRQEYIKRAAFALLWGLTTHDKQSGDAPFLRGLQLIERAAVDERHFVMKAVNMALRAVGKRNPALNAAAVAVARRLAESPAAAPRWIGKDALRELTSITVIRRLERVSKRAG
ncbi:MAG: DNA alkylation repair protein [Gemmatimonadales bacterium]